MTQDIFSSVNIKNIDYKDVEILRRFLNPHGRILSRKTTGLTAKGQRKITIAIKRSRFMGLLPFIAR